MEEKTREALKLENEELKERLREAEEVLRAIRSGEDALAVPDSGCEKIYSLSGADRVYGILIDTMSEGALTVSSDGTILHANNRAHEMLHAPALKVVGASLFDFVLAQDRESTETLLSKGREENSRGKIRFLTSKGVIVPARVSVSSLEFEEASSFCILLSDLSEEERVQEELSQYRNHLENLVEERTAELQKTQRELEARIEERTVALRAYTARLEEMNRELQEFTYIASHDLQEPLRKIQIFCTRIEAATCRDFSPDVETLDDLERMKKSANRMQNLIQALLTYSHVLQNPRHLEMVNLNDLMLKVQAELSHSIKETGARVRCWDLPIIEADSRQMHRLFQNLLENALKFHRSEPPSVTIYGEERADAAAICIEDNGMGLDEGQLNNIFKPFQQLHRRGVFEGTGIGLAVCRKIVESHGGAITVESAPGVGSKFIVTLPMRQPALDGRLELPEDTLRDCTKADLQQEIYKVRKQLRESEEVISAIREGKIDALVSYEPEGERVYTLKSADRGYRRLVESIDEGALILSSEGSIFYSNPRFEQMLKRDGQKTTASPLIEHVEDRAKLEALLDEARQGHPARGEVRLKASDDTLLPVSISLRPLHMEGFHGLCITLTDLTEQKLYIERLEQSNQELQDFAFIASHDLQEPLRKIQAFGDRLKAQCADQLSPGGQDYLERMQNASNRMRTFITDLLNYSRVATRAAPFKEFDLGEIVREALSDLQVRIDETGGQIEIGDLPSLYGDPGQMRQLFLNLIGNALKFHGQRKPMVKIHGSLVDEDPGEAAMDGTASRLCRIFVEDNGIGFDEKYAERIFAPFQRLHGKSTYEGTGIGLALCKKIIERHGGAIMAKSASGKGSTFIVTLPLRNHQEGDRK